MAVIELGEAVAKAIAVKDPIQTKYKPR